MQKIAIIITTITVIGLVALAGCNPHDAGGAQSDAGINNNVNQNTNQNNNVNPATEEVFLHVMSLGKVSCFSLETGQSDFCPAAEDAVYGPLTLSAPGGMIVVGRDHLRVESDEDVEFWDVPTESVQNYEEVMRAAGLLPQGTQPVLFPLSAGSDPQNDLDIANLLRGLLCADGINMLSAAHWCPSAFINGAVFHKIKTGKVYEWELHGYNKVVFVLKK